MFSLEKIRWQAMGEISGGFDEETDRNAAVTHYINSMTNCELLELIERALN